MTLLTVLQEELAIERERYSKNILGKLVAIGIYCSLLQCVPALLSRIVPTLLQVASPQMTYTIIFSGAIFLTALLFNTFMLFVYKAKLPFFQQYRVGPSRKWPWEEDAQGWSRILWRTMSFNVTNLLIPMLLTYADCQMKFNFILAPEKAPSSLLMIKYLAVMYFLQDFLFFTAHWLLHTPFLYKHIHKIHHQYNTTISIAGLHAHFLETLLSNALPAKLYLFVVELMFGPVHINTIAIWLILRIYDAYNGHSGYMFSWTPIQILPFCAYEDFHDFHHSHNCGNFSSQLRIWDILFGTNQRFKEYKQKIKKEKAL